MADFTLRITAGVAAGAWTDPEGPQGQPSRVNARVGLPHRRWIGHVGVPVVIKTVVGGVEAPADGSLGGRLFIWWIVQAPVAPYTDPQTSPGFSATALVIPTKPGHYTVGCVRNNGGIELVSFDVLDP